MGIEPMTNGLLDQRSTDWAMRPTQISKKTKTKNSKAGNRTRVSCVTGRNTNHCTTSEHTDQNVDFNTSAPKKWYILDLCVSSLRRGHANLLCIVPILSYETAVTPLEQARFPLDSNLRPLQEIHLFSISRTSAIQEMPPYNILSGSPRHTKKCSESPPQTPWLSRSSEKKGDFGAFVDQKNEKSLI